MCPCRDITGCRWIESNNRGESGETPFLSLPSPLNAYGQGDVERGEGVKASYCLIIVFKSKLIDIEHTAGTSRKEVSILACRTNHDNIRRFTIGSSIL